VLAFAGLYEIWGPDRLLTSSIVTTAALGQLVAVHNRMPLMLPRTAWSALTGGERVMHVEYVPSPYYAVREVRLRPAEYRRLWAAIRADFVLGANGRPQRIAHPGYGPSDAFYRATGHASMFRTCNSWAAGKLRFAGVKTSLWPPFAEGLVWRYREYNGLRLLSARGRSG